MEERRSAENAALRELVDALKDFIAARDALWSLGFFDRLFRFSRCVAMLNRYDAARERVRNAIKAVWDAGGQERPAASECMDGPELSGDLPAQPPTRLISLEEFEMLMDRPAILKNRPQVPNGSGAAGSAGPRRNNLGGE